MQDLPIMKVKEEHSTEQCHWADLKEEEEGEEEEEKEEGEEERTIIHKKID